MKEFLIENWFVITTTVAIPLAWIVVRLTPTKWDDRLLKLIVTIIKLIPDNKKGGGKHE